MNILIRYYSFLVVFLYSLNIIAQSNIEKRLLYYYNDITSKEYYYNDIIESVEFDGELKVFLDSIHSLIYDIEMVSDSALYCYHYLQAVCNESNEEIMYHHIEKTVEICEERLGIFDIEYIDLISALAFRAQECGQIDKAISLYQKILVKGGFLLEKESTPRLRLRKGTILYRLGGLYVKKEYEREAIQCFRAAHNVMKQDYEENDLTLMMPLFHLGCYYDFNKKDHIKAIEVWKELIQYLENNGTYSGKYYNDWTFHLICNIAKSGDKETAYKKYQELIERIKTEEGIYSENLNSVYGNYFIILGELGYYSELEAFKPILRDYYTQIGAPEDYAKALYAVSTVINGSDKNIASKTALELEELSVSKRMLLLFNLGIDEETAPKDAIEYLKQSLALAEELNNGRMNEECKYIVEWLSFRYYENKELHKAIEVNEELLSILEAIGEQDSDSYFYALFRISNILFELEQYDKILPIEELLYSLTLNRFGDDSQEMARCYNMMAISHMYMGHYRKARKYFNKSMKIFQIHMNTNSDAYNEIYSTYLHNMGRLHMFKEEYSKAKEYFAESINLSLKTTGKVNPKTERYLNEIESKEL